jgi:hypothetical protein
MARNTQTERASADRLIGRMHEQARRNGVAIPDTRGIERKVREIAERSDAQRRDNRRKDGT